MDYQDFKNVILKPKSKIEVKEIIEKKKNTTNSSILLNDNDEVIKIKKVSKEISNTIINARIFKKLTRKQLANQLNLKEDVITNIETGKAIYDGVLIAKIKKHLGVK